MKYAKFSDDFLSDFRLDDNGETLVLTDKRGFTRAVKLLPYEERPQGDLISREALKKVFNGYHSGIGSQPKFTLGACLQLIDNAPTVEPSTESLGLGGNPKETEDPRSRTR